MAANPNKGAAHRRPTGSRSPPATQPAGADGKPTTQPIASAPAVKPIKEGDVAVKDIGTVEIHVNDANLIEVLRMLSPAAPEEHRGQQGRPRHGHAPTSTT